MSALSPDQGFEVGEVVTFMGHHGHRDVTIVGPLQFATWLPDFTGATSGYAYHIRENPETCPYERLERAAYPWQLRKKRPPREDLKLVRWSECPWQPEKVHV